MKIMPTLCLLISSTALAEERADPHHVYQLDFVVADQDAGKSATTAHFTINLEEKHGCEIKLGTNVALGSARGTPVRADIGLVLHAVATSLGEDVLLDTDVEISAAQDTQTFRKMSAKGSALIAQGKPALVASVEDPINHKHYQVTVTATKLR